jgi:MerR HTH family regulatory protein
MFSIGEFARLGTVSVRTLRHYDEIGLLRPARVDPDTGYRGYWADQLGQLNRIVALKDLGLSLNQVRLLMAGITGDEHHYRTAGGPGREVWVNMVDDVADVGQQVFEIRLPFTRQGTGPSFPAGDGRGRAGSR